MTTVDSLSRLEGIPMLSDTLLGASVGGFAVVVVQTIIYTAKTIHRDGGLRC